MEDPIWPRFQFALTEEIENTEPFYLDGNCICPINFIPTRIHPTDTGLDVRCAELSGMELKPGCYFKMKLGFRMLAPAGWWMQLFPRSSTFYKSHIHSLYGVIDELFSGEMCFVGQYIPDACTLLSSKDLVIPFGGRIAQLVPTPRYEISKEVISSSQYLEKIKAREQQRSAGFGGSGIA